MSNGFKMSSSPMRSDGRICTECGRVFTTALDKRGVCVRCKGVTAAELKQLTGGVLRKDKVLA